MTTKLDIQITEINYVPVRPLKGHMGFVSFVINDMFYIGSIAIYTRLNPLPKQSLYRLVYPLSPKSYAIFTPTKKEIFEIIEKDVSCYIENLKG